MNKRPGSAIKERARSRFEVLVRHFLARFVQNDWTLTDEHTSLLAQISVVLALPGLLLALFLFPAYHGFPPNPAHREFWDAVGDHYFYVMDSFVVMAAVAVFEWDFLFPDLVDVYVLAILPLTARRLFAAKTAAGAIFFALMLLGANLFGTIFLPMLAASENPLRQLWAHACAVLAAGAFAACAMIALQGLFVVCLGARVMAKMASMLQASLVVGLLAVLVLFPATIQMMRPSLLGGSTWIWWFPPFWFLGIYERMLHGSTSLAIFTGLAQAGWRAVAVSSASAIVIFPLAYLRRVQHTTEGGQTRRSEASRLRWIGALLDRLLLRTPGQRAMAHFVAQSVPRLARPRVLLAMYGGLGLALAMARVMAVQTQRSGANLVMFAPGAYAVVPTLCFWMVAGMSAVVGSAAEVRAAWVFRVSIGRAQPEHLRGTRRLIVLAAGGASVLVATLLRAAQRADAMAYLLDLLTAFSCALLLTDVLLYGERSVPFTRVRRGSFNDLPLAFVQYVVAFPIFVTVVTLLEIRGEASGLAACLIIAGCALLHALAKRLHAKAVEQQNLDLVMDLVEHGPQQLGLG